jgi:hypothetical protein
MQYPEVSMIKYSIAGKWNCSMWGILLVSCNRTGQIQSLVEENFYVSAVTVRPDRGLQQYAELRFW